MDKLPKLAEFESQLNSIRIPAVEAAQKRKDRLAEARINRLSGQTADLIRLFLSEDKVRQFREEVRELIQAVEAPADESRSKPNVTRSALPPDRYAIGASSSSGRIAYGTVRLDS